MIHSEKKTFSVAATSCLSFLRRDTWNYMYFEYFLKCFWIKTFILSIMYFKYFLKCFWIVTFILSIWQASSMAVRAVQVAISDSLRRLRQLGIETIVFWGSCAQLHMWYMEKNTNVQSEPIPTQPTIPFSIALFSVK